MAIKVKDGAVAVVTGASEGLGRVFARELARYGFRIVAVARNKERLSSLIDELGEGHRYVVADLSKSEDVKRIETEAADPLCQVLINNAGFGMAGTFSEQPIDRLMDVVQVNISALTRLSHAFLSHAQKGDALINLGSIVGLVPYPGQAVYSATKAYVTFFTESLWVKYRSKGIYVQNLSPGPTRTEFFSRARHGSMERNPWMFEPAESVVTTSLKAWHHNRGGSILSGWFGPATWYLSRLLTRRTAARLSGFVE